MTMDEIKGTFRNSQIFITHDSKNNTLKDHIETIKKELIVDKKLISTVTEKNKLFFFRDLSNENPVSFFSYAFQKNLFS
jgi:hypothetical protein